MENQQLKSQILSLIQQVKELEKGVEIKNSLNIPFAFTINYSNGDEEYLFDEDCVRDDIHNGVTYAFDKFLGGKTFREQTKVFRTKLNIYLKQIKTICNKYGLDEYEFGSDISNLISSKNLSKKVDDLIESIAEYEEQEKELEEREKRSHIELKSAFAKLAKAGLTKREKELLDKEYGIELK